MSPIEVSCKKCGTIFHALLEQIGHLTCPKCGETKAFTVIHNYVPSEPLYAPEIPLYFD
ncbi:MAG: hypothetical protein ACTSSI_16130 [Candidatus Helarchaeota archaeon]